jgi:FkbM family methyltransferase
MFKKISNKIQFLKFLKRSRTNSKIIKRIVKKKICIIDIGAGHRYLSSLLNFDGSAEIHMIDPHKSLLWSSENLKKIIENKEDVKTYQVGIGAQTMKKVMYMGTRPTASTFLNIFKLSKGKKYELDMKYFSKNKQLVNIFSFKDFLKKFNIKSPSIIKIDVEGMEDIVLNSILKSCRPFLLQIEVNVNSELYNNTFNKMLNL